MDSQVSRAHGCTGATQLKTPCSDGATQVIFELLDFMSHIPVLHPSGDPCRANWLSCQFVIARLAALVPKPRVNLTRFHGVFAPNSKHRVDVTPAKHGKGRAKQENEEITPELLSATRASPNSDWFA
jgi:hypothetical protein